AFEGSSDWANTLTVQAKELLEMYGVSSAWRLQTRTKHRFFRGKARFPDYSHPAIAGPRRSQHRPPTDAHISAATDTRSEKRLPAVRRSAGCDRAARRRPGGWACAPDAARRHGFGKDLLHSIRHSARAASDAGARS